MRPLYPTVRVTLRSRNRFAWVSAIRAALRRAGIAGEEIERFTRVALLTGNRRRFETFCRLWVQLEGPAVQSAGEGSV